MVKLKFGLIAIGLFIFCIGCRVKQVLPDATEEGKNTFGVKIDGKVWRPIQQFSVTGGPRMLQASINDHVLGIVARKRFSDEAITLLVVNVKSVGIYKFKETDSGGIRPSSYDGDLVDDEYVPYSGGVNEINISKLDTVNRIVSGTFQIQLKGKNKNSIKNLTQGIFDIKYEK